MRTTATTVASAAENQLRLRSVLRQLAQSLRATASEKEGVTAEETAPPRRVRATLTNRLAYASADTLPAGSIAAID